MKNLSTKRTYLKPALTTFGSVKELTGTKSGVGPGDGATMMNT